MFGPFALTICNKNFFKLALKQTSCLFCVMCSLIYIGTASRVKSNMFRDYDNIYVVLLTVFVFWKVKTLFDVSLSLSDIFKLFHLNYYQNTKGRHCTL